MNVEAKRIQTIVHDVKLGRVRPDRQAISQRVREIFRLSEPEMVELVDSATEAVSALGLPNQPEERTEMPEPTVLRGAELVRAGAKIFRRDPSMTARQVYDELVADGHNIGISVKSWVGASATKARRAAAGEGPAGPPVSPRAAKKSAKKGRSRAAVVKEIPRSTSTTTGTSSPEPECPPSTLARVSAERGGRRIDARETPDGWHLEFSGPVPEGMVDDLVELVWEGA